MGDIQVGDLVIGSQGTPIRVIGVFPQGEKDIYRVTFSDESSTQCCEEHLWYVTRPLRKWRGQPGQVIELKDLMQELRDAAGNSRWFIPMVKPVEFNAQYLPLDPYLLGVLIGDGTLRANSTYLSSTDEELRISVEALLPSGVKMVFASGWDYRISTGRRGGNEPVKNPVTEALKGLGLAGKRAESKFIPSPYQLGRATDRVALLQGLLDTDGTVSDQNHIEFATSSIQLAQDVVALVQSLGGRARVRNRIPSYTYKGERRQGQRAYRVNIALPPEIKPFRLSRKANRYTPRSKYKPTRAIVSVEYVGRKEAQCIAVDALDHLYVTDDYIVTHNTVMGMLIGHALQQFLTGQTK